MIKVLVTGSEGFVGQTFIKSSNDKYFIYGLTLGDKSPDTQGFQNLRYIEGNILNRALIKNILSDFKPDVILHLAAIALTTKTSIEEVMEINFNGTLSLFLSILEVQEKIAYNPKIIFISSAEVYGKSKNPENIKEEDPFYPTSVYASSKAAGDRLSYQLSQSNNLWTLELRPFPHTGPGQRIGFFVPDMISQIVEVENGKKSEISVGNVDVTRDYLDVRDVVEVYKYFIENEYYQGDAFNISSGKGIKLTEILKILKSLSKKELNFKTDPSRLRKNDNSIFVGNCEKLKNFTGWEPKIPIEQTLKDTLDYYRQIWKDGK
jgi:GDP-4-dehydro-6-deoxy-D-mannose reductase